jgi:PAT family beta-lactamase induction signal transducer AmpG
VTLAERRVLRLVTLALLFFAQGVPWGFMAIELPAYLASQGLDDAARGTLVAMTTWPFAFKWVWGPMMDALPMRRFGRRRPWIVLAQSLMALTIAALLLLAPDLARPYWLLVAIVLAHTMFNAMQNVATDALAIDLLDARERGRASGIMYGCKYAGGILGAAGSAAIVERWNMEVAIALQAIVLAAIVLVPLYMREQSGPPPPRQSLREVASAIADAFRMRSTIVAAAAVFALSLASGALAVAAQGLFMGKAIDGGLAWSSERYSEVAGGPGLAVGFIGSLAAGALADLVGPRRLAALASAVMASGWIVFALGRSWWDNNVFVGGLFVVEPLAQSVMIVSLWSVCMSASLKRIAATQFAIYTALFSLAASVGAQLIAPLATRWWSYDAIYLGAAAVQLAAIALLPFIDSVKTTQKPS